MKDIFDKCYELTNGMNAYVKNSYKKNGQDLGIYFDYAKKNIFYRESPIDNCFPEAFYRGEKLLQFGINNYLGIAGDEELRKVAVKYVKAHGISTPMGSRILTGNTLIHHKLEKEIAEFKKTEAALSFGTGANAMSGVVSALAEKDDLIILDQFAHASLYCGAKISGAEIRRFRHNDINDLENILRNSVNKDQGKLVVVDGVYSMHGDMVPIKDICDICEKHNARIILDDAHGNGVIGEEGRGVAELWEVEDRIDVHAGTFSKAFGTKGGFIASKKEIIDYLSFTSYSNLFTKSQPAVFVATTIKAIELVTERGSELRAKLSRSKNYLHNRLRNMDFDLGKTETNITPLFFPDLYGLYISDELYKKYKIMVPVSHFPAIPLGQTLLRVIVTSMHTQDQMDYFCDSLYSICNKLPKGVMGSKHN